MLSRTLIFRFGWVLFTASEQWRNHRVSSMNKFYLRIFLMLAVSSSPVFAQGPGWTPPSKIQKIVVTSDGGINVRLTPELSGCVSNSGYGPQYASVYPSHPGIDRIHATLLSAQAQDKVVSIYLVDSACKAVEVELGGR